VTDSDKGEAGLLALVELLCFLAVATSVGLAMDLRALRDIRAPLAAADAVAGLRLRHREPGRTAYVPRGSAFGRDRVDNVHSRPATCPPPRRRRRGTRPRGT